MAEIKRYDGKEEFSKLLKSFTVVPSNSEIVEKTGVSKGSISEIMNGKRTPTKNFIDKFKKGFGLNIKEIKNPPESEGFNIYKENEILKKDNEFLKETIKELLRTLNK